MDFINLLKEEWSYHLMNLGILMVFSIYGAYATIKKRVKLEVFREFEKTKKKLSNEQKSIIAIREKKQFMKEFMKAFSVLFMLYIIYILYRSGIFQ